MGGGAKLEEWGKRGGGGVLPGGVEDGVLVELVEEVRVGEGFEVGESVGVVVAFEDEHVVGVDGADGGGDALVEGGELACFRSGRAWVR